MENYPLAYIIRSLIKHVNLPDQLALDGDRHAKTSQLPVKIEAQGLITVRI